MLYSVSVTFSLSFNLKWRQKNFVLKKFLVKKNWSEKNSTKEMFAPKKLESKATKIGWG